MTGATAAALTEPTGPAGPAASEEVRGRATGVLVTAFFGLAWIGWGLSSAGPALLLPVLIPGALVAAGLMTGGVRLIVAARKLPAGRLDPARGRRTMHRFAWINGLQWLVLGALAGVLGAFGHPQWIPAVVCVVVGVHFLPLAALFRLRLYYSTGIALILIGVATMAILLGGPPDPLWWQAFPGVGAAVVLLATGTALLAATLRMASGRGEHNGAGGRRRG